MRVVLAGFGPFPGAPFNPSGSLAKALAHSRRPALAGLHRTATVFATSYTAVDRGLPKLFAEKPDIVLVFGLAGRRRHVCIETRARNAVSVLFPDANRHRPAQSVIKLGGPQALTGRAPFVQLVGAVRAREVPVRLSRDAGRYLCNYIYWRTLERAPTGRRREPTIGLRRRGSECLRHFQRSHLDAVPIPQRRRHEAHERRTFGLVKR
jgi:pyroglutamyl-peptidase